jgi:hypothetical protein
VSQAQARSGDIFVTADSATPVTLHSQLILSLAGHFQVREFVFNGIGHIASPSIFADR